MNMRPWSMSIGIRMMTTISIRMGRMMRPESRTAIGTDIRHYCTGTRIIQTCITGTGTTIRPEPQRTQPPRYAATTAGLLATISAGPCVTMRPFSSTYA